MKKAIVMVIIAIVGLGAGATGGIFITNSKNKVVIADMQAKMQKSEAVSQDRIRSYEIVVSQLNDELRLAKTEIELLKTPAPAAEQTPPPAAEIEPIASAAPAEDSAPANTILYTIKSGDSLWTIAQKQLGNGSRFNEILKLNPNISAKSNLTIGTKLKIPAK